VTVATFLFCMSSLAEGRTLRHAGTFRGLPFPTLPHQGSQPFRGRAEGDICPRPQAAASPSFLTSITAHLSLYTVACSQDRSSQAWPTRGTLSRGWNHTDTHHIKPALGSPRSL
jgi:hypothetical protein